jgi:pimeloyl-ACP methyl ester carboxylesterase
VRTFLKVVGVLLGFVLIATAVVWATLRRPDTPWDALKHKYASADSRWVALPGGLQVHYRDQGDPKKPTVLLVHGFYSSLHTWEPWVKALGDDYRVVSLDLPGHGLTRAPANWPASIDSYVKTVDAFAQAEHLDRFVLVGSSMGGDVAWRYALTHPEKVRGLVLVDAAGWPDPRPGAGESTARLKLVQNPFGRAALRDLDASAQVRKGVERSWADKSKVDDVMVERYVELSRAPGHRDIILNLLQSYGGYRFATADRLAALKVPTLVMTGAKDEMVPPENARKFAAAIPGARLVSYPDVGHLPQEEAPAVSAADLQTFLASLEPKKPEKPKPATPRAPPPAALIFY